MVLSVRAGGSSDKPSLALCTSFAGLSQEEVAQFLGTLQRCLRKDLFPSCFCHGGFMTDFDGFHKA